MQSAVTDIPEGIARKLRLDASVQKEHRVREYWA